MSDDPVYTHWAEFVGEDVLSDPPVGFRLRTDTVRITPSATGTSPADVENFDVCDGALLAVGVMYGDHFQIEGTAVAIAPGLAISAKHLVDQHYPTTGKPGQGDLMCLGPRQDGELQWWHCYSLRYSDANGGDLALLSLRLLSKVSDGMCLKIFPLTPRLPAAGETVTAIGFRFEQPATVEHVDGIPSYFQAGRLYVASGAAGTFSTSRADGSFWRSYDPSEAQYATLEVECGTLGGMSGGAVVDGTGALVGIISKGLETADHGGPSLAQWWIDLAAWEPELSWPMNMYQPGTAVVDIPLIIITDRELIERTAADSVRVHLPDGRVTNEC